VGSFIPKGIVTQTEWDRARRLAILNCDDRCRGCDEPLVPNARPRSAMSTTVDHIVPRSSFIHMDRTMVRHYFLGQHNLAVMHNRCNAAKSAREPTTAYPTATASAPANGSLDWAARSLEQPEEITT
jgi:5-methylcytosine-specific restriction endonuclease McrA